jgi:hypothetical protein
MFCREPQGLCSGLERLNEIDAEKKSRHGWLVLRPGVVYHERRMRGSSIIYTTGDGPEEV